MKPDPDGGTAVLFVNLGTGTNTGRFSLDPVRDNHRAGQRP